MFKIEYGQLKIYRIFIIGIKFLRKMQKIGIINIIDSDKINSN